MDQTGGILQHAWTRSGQFASLAAAVALLGAVTMQPHAVSAQPAGEAGEYAIQNFAPNEYGGGVQTWDFLQGPRGLMYMANNDGILEYDGATWRLTPASNESTVRSLALSDTGGVYAGAQNDVGYLKPSAAGASQFVSLRGKVPQSARDFGDVWHTAIGPDGVYFQTYKYLLRWSGTDSLTVWRPASYFVYVDRIRGHLYVQDQDEGLLRMEGDSLRPAPGGKRFVGRRPFAMAPYGEDRMLVATAQALYLYDEEHLTRFETEADAFLKKNHVYTAAALPGERFAIGTLQGGVAILDKSGKLMRVLDEEDGLQDKIVVGAGADAQGGLWLGLNRGISRVGVARPVTAFGKPSGLDGSVVDVQRYRGALYAASTAGVFRLKWKATWDHQAAFQKVPGIKKQCWMLEPTDRGVLAGCSGKVLLIREGRIVSSRSARRFFALHRSRRTPSRLFVGGEDGLAQVSLEGDEIRVRAIDSVDVPVRTMAEDEQGRLWLATAYEGVARVTFDSTGRVKEFTRYTGEDGLPDDEIYAYTLGGRPLFASQNGLLQFTGDDEAAFAPDSTLGAQFAGGSWSNIVLNTKRDSIAWVCADERVGVARKGDAGRYEWQPLSLPRVARSSRNNIYVEDDNVLWIGVAEGLLRYDRASPHPEPELPTMVRRVSTLDGDSLLYGGAGPRSSAPLLDYTHNGLRFEFAALSYAHPEALGYQYKLDHFDEGWSAWKEQPSKEYTNLPIGTYTFRVRGRDSYGQASRAGTYAFRILPPWYRTNWAYLLATLLILGLVTSSGYGYNRWRTRQLQQRNRRLRQRVDERTRALQQKAQTLERTNRELKRTDEQRNEFLSTIVHDLKNPLIGIRGTAAILSEEREEQSPVAFQAFADEFLNLIHNDVEQMLHIIEDLLRAQVLENGQVELCKEPTSLNDLAASVIWHNQSQARRKRIALSFEAETEWRIPLDEMQMRRAVGNLVSNAIKFSPSESSVTVRLAGDSERVRLEVIDEGPGLTEADKHKAFGKLQTLSATPTGDESSSGLGLYIVKQIVEQHGGHVGVESTPGKGATFHVALPVGEPDALART